MNKILKTITENCWKNGSNYKEIKGNYCVIKKLNSIKHFYYGHLICIVDLKEKQFVLDYCGYRSYRLTTAQMNFFKNYYKGKGFILIKEIYG